MRWTNGACRQMPGRIASASYSAREGNVIVTAVPRSSFAGTDVHKSDSVSVRRGVGPIRHRLGVAVGQSSRLIKRQVPPRLCPHGQLRHCTTQQPPRRAASLTSIPSTTASILALFRRSTTCNGASTVMDCAADVGFLERHKRLRATRSDGSKCSRQHRPPAGSATTVHTEGGETSATHRCMWGQW